MCGIIGVYNVGGTNADLVERMASRMAHRGPDGFGMTHDGVLAFGALRLAIIDLAAPAGPIFNEDGTIGIVFNGEIYNYRELMTELKHAGHRYNTQTDTEVIVHGYEEWGDDVISRLRRMFALGIWDSNRQRLLLVRIDWARSRCTIRSKTTVNSCSRRRSRHFSPSQRAAGSQL